MKCKKNNSSFNNPVDANSGYKIIKDANSVYSMT